MSYRSNWVLIISCSCQKRPKSWRRVPLSLKHLKPKLSSRRHIVWQSQTKKGRTFEYLLSLLNFWLLSFRILHHFIVSYADNEALLNDTLILPLLDCSGPLRRSPQGFWVWQSLSSAAWNYLFKRKEISKSCRIPQQRHFLTPHEPSAPSHLIRYSVTPTAWVCEKSTHLL